MKILRTASQGSKFTGSYKKGVYSLSAFINSYEIFSKSNFQYSDCLYLKVFISQGGTSNNKYRKRSIYHHSHHPTALHIPGIAILLLSHRCC